MSEPSGSRSPEAQNGSKSGLSGVQVAILAGIAFGALYVALKVPVGRPTEAVGVISDFRFLGKGTTRNAVLVRLSDGRDLIAHIDVDNPCRVGQSVRVEEWRTLIGAHLAQVSSVCSI